MYLYTILMCVVMRFLWENEAYIRAESARSRVCGEVICVLWHLVFVFALLCCLIHIRNGRNVLDFIRRSTMCVYKLISRFADNKMEKL